MQFSIIIPTYKRPGELHECLQSIVELDYPRNQFEVVVVDDGSPTPVEPVVASFVDQIQVEYVRKANGGPGAARNQGADLAKGKVLGFTDDDCRPAPDWLRQFERQLQRTPNDLLGGRTVNRLRENLFSQTSQLIVDIVYAYYNQDPSCAQFFASNNMAVSADRFRELGGFDGHNFRIASEDRELCDRWRNNGGGLTYVPGAVIHHGHPLTLSSFSRQHFAYGRGAFQYHAVRRKRGSGRLQDDMGFHANLPGLLRTQYAGLGFSRACATSAILGVWQLANAAGFLYEGSRRLIRRGHVSI